MQNNKRMSAVDINDRRKRQRQLLAADLINLNSSDSDSDSSVSSLSTTASDSSAASDPENNVAIYPPKRRNCDKFSKILDAQKEILTMLKELKKDSEDFQKKLMLQVQINNQEILEHLQTVRNYVDEAVASSARKFASDSGDNNGNYIDNVNDDEMDANDFLR